MSRDIDRFTDEELRRELEQRESAEFLGEAVLELCERIGLPQEVHDHIKDQLLKTNPQDFAAAALHLTGVASLFAEPAYGEDVLTWPSNRKVDDDTRTIVSTASDETVESVPLEPSAELGDEGSAPEEGIDTVSAWSDAGLKKASNLLGAQVDPGVSIESVARQIYIAAGEPQPRIRSGGRPPYNPIERIICILRGDRLEAISATDGSSVGAIRQWWGQIQKQARQSVRSSLEAGQLEQADNIEATKLSLANGSILPVELASGVDEEPPHVVLADKAIALIPGVNKEALKGLLAPKDRGEMTVDRADIIERLVDRLEASGGVATLDQLEIPDNSRACLRKFLGVGFIKNGRQQESRSPLSLSEQLRSIPDHSYRARYVEHFNQGFEALLSALANPSAESRKIIREAGILQVRL